MNKKFFKRSSVFTSILALLATLFVAAPAAQAAVEPVTLSADDSYGTYTVLNGSSFFLHSWVTNEALNGGIYHNLSYNIKNVGSSTPSIHLNQGQNNWSEWDQGTWRTKAPGTDFSTYAYNSGSSGVRNDLSVGVNNYDNTVDSKLQVTAFVDYNDNGDVDPNEPSSNPITITFVDARGMATTTSITSTYEGADQIEANVKFANKDINLEQVAQSISWGFDLHSFEGEECGSNLGVYWSRNNVSDESFTGYNGCVYFSTHDFRDIDDNVEGIYYDSTAKAIIFPWTNDIDGKTGDVAKGLYTATLYVFEARNESYDWAKLGTSAQAVVAENVVDAVSLPKPATGPNLVTFIDPLNYGNQFIARVGNKSITYS
ncbi:MAG: hypothetical protein WCO24_03085, partial [Actinomycetes bacterium]